MKSDRGSAQAWIMGCLGVIAICVILLIGGVWLLYRSFVKPYGAEAAPQDLIHFVDDIEAGAEPSYPVVLFITTGPGDQMMMVMGMMDQYMFNFMDQDGISDDVRMALVDFESDFPASIDSDTPNDISMMVDIDSDFEETIAALVAALTQYSERETWSYRWTGNRLELPDHIESGPSSFDQLMPTGAMGAPTFTTVELTEEEFEEVSDEE